MKIKSFEVTDLFGRHRAIDATLNDDINIITGRNGAGKTTILKLLWYVISGNINHAIREVEFSKLSVETTEYKCTVYRLNPVTCRVEIEYAGELLIFEDTQDSDGDHIRNAEDDANQFIQEIGVSVFLPTFRRIEGGFTLGAKRSPFSTGLISRATGSKNDIEEGLTALSRFLTNAKHTFVASISTADVVSLLLQQYADMSELSNNLQRSTSQSVVDQIKAFKGQRSVGAELVIEDILTKIESMDAERERIMSPFDAITGLARGLFKHSGIQIGGRMSIGEAAHAINSDFLSAGEKQMLSFICYNAFHKNSVFIIDEPELSLHVDWQRQLFPILQDQGTSNQFIVATHSPFIYTKYPEKEVMLGRDRGDLAK